MAEKKAKKRAKKKNQPQNPNQLSFSFSDSEDPIEIHLPKHKINYDTLSSQSTNKAFITLSQF